MHCKGRTDIPRRWQIRWNYMQDPHFTALLSHRHMINRGTCCTKTEEVAEFHQSARRVTDGKLLTSRANPRLGSRYPIPWAVMAALTALTKISSKLPPGCSKAREIKNQNRKRLWFPCRRHSITRKSIRPHTHPYSKNPPITPRLPKFT